jgi:hypothetical protein
MGHPVFVADLVALVLGGMAGLDAEVLGYGGVVVFKFGEEAFVA